MQGGRERYVCGQIDALSSEHGATMLNRELSEQLNAVAAMFAEWNAETSAKRQQALAARGFSNLEHALLVFNKRGERRKGIRKAQDWYFAARQHSGPSDAQPCARCCVCVRRREIYFVDKAKDWQQADELCRACLQCVMRQVLGDDDAAILAEAASILDSGWSPVLNPRLADVLLDRRTHFSLL